MLGDKIGEETGKVTGQRVLATDGPPMVETSFQASGSLYGVSHMTIGTYLPGHDEARWYSLR